MNAYSTPKNNPESLQWPHGASEKRAKQCYGPHENEGAALTTCQCTKCIDILQGLFLDNKTLQDEHVSVNIEMSHEKTVS